MTRREWQPQMMAVKSKTSALLTVQRTNSVTPQKYRPDIDGLRAIAVLAVVGYHAFPKQMPGGFIGVDIFFVISGFLISTIIFTHLADRTFSYADFYARRIRRIFPALLVVLIAAMAIGWFVLLATEYKQLAKHIVGGADFLSNFVLWTETGYFDIAAEKKPLLHLWSLGVEEQFYILWPLIIGFAYRRRVDFLYLTIGVAVLSFSLNILTIHQHPEAAFYSPLTRMWELMGGGILAYLTVHGRNFLVRAKNWQSAGGLLLIFACLAFLNKNHPFPGYWALLPVMGAMLIISAGSDAWPNRMWLSSRPFASIGLISYPLYLWHWPLLSFASISADGSLSTGIRLSLVALAGLLATATYVIIERPIRFSVQGRLATRALVALSMVVTAVGVLIYCQDGFGFRLINNNPTGFDFGIGAENDRVNQCFLAQTAGPPFPDSCAGPRVPTGRPIVLIWGDSHAQSFSLGFPAHSTTNFDIAQYTASGCPPLLDFTVANRKQCREINDFIATKVVEIRPKTVILSAFWSLYNGFEGWSLLNLSKLQKTVDFLHSNGINDIIVIGNFPIFFTDQPRIGVYKFVGGKIDRTYYNFDSAARTADESLRTFSTTNHLEFVSPLEIFCNDDGCLLSTSADRLTPVAWDYGHLTKAGADYLISKAIARHEMTLP